MMLVPAMHKQGIKQFKQQMQTPLLLYGFFLCAIIIDVGGAFGLKYAAFAIMSVYVLMAGLTNKKVVPRSFLIIEGALFIIAPIFFLFLAIALFAVPPVVAVRELTPFATWLLYPVLLQIRQKEKIVSFFTTALFWGAVFTIIVFCTILLLYFLGQGELIAKINIFTNEYRLGYFGQKPFEGNFSAFFPNVYFRWTLLLIPAAILLLQGNKMKFNFVVLAIFLTTSTAAILFLLLGLLWASFNKLLSGMVPRLYIKRLILVGGILLIIVSALYLLGYGHIINFIAKKLSGSSASTSIKVGHIKTILTLLSQDVVTFLFGMGVGSSFYSIGADKVVTNVEVSHFNLMRQFGVLYTVGFFSYVFFLFISLRQLDRIGKLLSIGLVMLFIAAGTNPLLISPIFFLLMVIARAYITLYAKERRVLHIKPLGLTLGGGW